MHRWGYTHLSFAWVCVWGGGGQVNGISTPTLDAFLEAVKDIGDKSAVRVKTVSDGTAAAAALLRRNIYWTQPPFIAYETLATSAGAL